MQNEKINVKSWHLPFERISLRAGDRVYLLLLLFVVVLLSANGVWKLCVREDNNTVRLLTADVTPFFNSISRHTADNVYCLIHPLRQQLMLKDELVLAYPNGNSTRLSWSCTPVKQIFIFVCLILFTPPFFRRRALHKCWYIPLCALLLYGINILRISIIVLVIEQQIEWFEMVHTYILKYAYYAIIFLLWVVWVWFSRPQKNQM